MQLLRRDRTDAPQSLDGERVEEPQLVLDGDDEEPVRLAECTRHLGEVLRAGHADRDGQADPGSHVGAQLLRDGGRRTADAAQAADLEERLVDRDALDERGGVVEDVEHVAARLGVRVHPGRDDDRVGAQPQRLAPAHGGAHALGLGLVAAGQYDPAADDRRTSAQARVVALLDRREERVEVGVQHGAFGHVFDCFTCAIDEDRRIRSHLDQRDTMIVGLFAGRSVVYVDGWTKSAVGTSGR